jgi:putative ABC transport system permease protein
MTPGKQRKPFWYLVRGRQAIRDGVDEELRVHLELRAEELHAQGLPMEEARREARRQFGDLDATRQYCRQQDEQREMYMQRELVFQDFVQDVRISVRSLLRVPVLTLTVLLTVGLGLGATTVMFAAVNAALLRPLPYAEPERLVWIYTDAPPFEFRFSVADYLALEAEQTHFDRIAGFTSRTMVFSDGDGAEVLTGRLVSWTYFGLLGLTPVLGRDFAEIDGRPGSPPAVIVSHGFWQQRLNGRTDAIGKPIKLDGREHALAGVLPVDVGPLEQRQEFFVAAQFSPPTRKGPFQYWMLGRLRAGVDPAAAASELRAINRSLFPLWKSSYQDEKATWALRDLKTRLVGSFRTTVGVSLGAVLLVWLIACANASNLLVARVTSRRRELAVRAALGASRRRILRHLLVESAVLAAGSAAIGVAIAWLGIRLMPRLGAAYFPRTQEITFDGAVVAVLLGATLVSGLIFGLIPALHGTGGPVNEPLQSVGRSSTGSLSVRRLRQVLVGTQFAISTPLLVVAALLLVSLNELSRVDIGFDGRNLLTGSIRLPAALYQAPASVTSFWYELTERLEALPGVSQVAFTDSLPPDSASNFNNFDLEDQPTPEGQSQPVTAFVAVTPEYFRALGLSLLEGRLLEERDAQRENLESVVVDRAWAKRFFPNVSPLGKRFKEGGCTQCPWTTVVGVVSDVKYVGLDQPDQGTVYTPMPGGLARFVVLRTEGRPQALVPSVRQRLRELDPNVPLTSVATIDDLVTGSLDQPRSLSIIVGAFAAIALLLSAVGIYGVMAYYVQQHAKDISIRLALGGRSADVLRLVLGRGMAVVLAGVVAGLLAAFASTRLFASLFFNVSAADPSTFFAVGVFLVGVALVACFVPAMRAVKLQPAVTLRND